MTLLVLYKLFTLFGEPLVALLNHIQLLIESKSEQVAHLADGGKPAACSRSRYCNQRPHTLVCGVRYNATLQEAGVVRRSTKTCQVICDAQAPASAIRSQIVFLFFIFYFISSLRTEVIYQNIDKRKTLD